MAEMKKVTNNDLQNTTQKNKDWATQTPQKTGVNSGAKCDRRRAALVKIFYFAYSWLWKIEHDYILYAIFYKNNN
jgi:hypothetical protein